MNVNELTPNDAASNETKQKQRVLLFSFSRWEHHLATDLELIQQHLSAGDAVTVLSCIEDVPSCRTNISHDAKGCRGCVSARFEGLELLDTSKGELSLVRMGDVLAQAGTAVRLGARFESLDQARELSVNGWDLGMAACSTAISAFRDHELVSTDAQEAWVKLAEAGHRSFCATRELLSRERYDRVYVFNGRDVLARGVFRAAQQAGVDVLVHERGRGNDRFSLHDNKLPHDRDGLNAAIVSLWDDADPNEREQVGAGWFDRSRAGVDQRYPSFVSDQEPGLLPPTWDPARKNVVIFNSSEDEYAAIGPRWKNPFYESQAEGTKALAQSLLADHNDICLWVRMHPNLARVDNSSTRAFAALEDFGVQLIPSASDISTYSLVDAADVVVSFGSTVGIEATYWGTPSVLLGPAPYTYLNATHNPAGHDEAVSMLRSDLLAADRTGALKYGYYLASVGEPFIHYHATGYHDGEFNGAPIRQGRTPLKWAAGGLARLRLDRPSLYKVVHPIARLVLHRPFAPLDQGRQQFVLWAAEQPTLRRLWQAAKARGLVSGARP